MKKFLLLLLACGMYAGAFAQIETSDKTSIKSEKWMITPNKLKTTTGRLLLNNTAGSLWVIYVYRMADNKYITSVNQSNNKGVLILPPGEYKITLNLAPVENVLIKKGHDTKLKTGVIDVPHTEVWYLYDETGKTYHSSGIKPEKLLMPAGNYTLKVGSQSSIVKVKNSNEENPENEEREIIDAAQYTLVPITENPESLLTGYGRIQLYPPTADLQVHMGFGIYKSGIDSSVFYCSRSWLNYCPENLPLPVGDYDIKFWGVYNNYTGGLHHCLSACHPLVLKNIPIQNGYETRLKMGYLSTTSPGIYQLIDESNQIAYIRYVPKGKGLHWPVGKYWVHVYFVGYFQVEIMDGKTTVLNPIDSTALYQTKWAIKPIGKIGSPKKGRLNSYFPDTNSIHQMSVFVPNPNTNPGYSVIKLDSLNSLDLAEGKYQVFLNGVYLELPIKANHETRIRYGYLDFWVPVGHGFQFQNAVTGAGNPGVKSGKNALPIGYYKIYINTHSFLIKINEGETVAFDYNEFYID